MGQHPVHDTVTKRYRHLNFFQHDCFLEVRVARVKLPDRSVRQVEPPWAGELSGFTLLFEALVPILCQHMTFAAAARIVGESRHRVVAICERYVDEALALTDLSAVRAVAIDGTSRARGHDDITLMADAERRRVLAVAEGRGIDSRSSGGRARQSPAGSDPSARFPICSETARNRGRRRCDLGTARRSLPRRVETSQLASARVAASDAIDFKFMAPDPSWSTASCRSCTSKRTGRGCCCYCRRCCFPDRPTATQTRP